MNKDQNVCTTIVRAVSHRKIHREMRLRTVANYYRATVELFARFVSNFLKCRANARKVDLDTSSDLVARRQISGSSFPFDRNVSFRLQQLVGIRCFRDILLKIF